MGRGSGRAIRGHRHLAVPASIVRQGRVVMGGPIAPSTIPIDRQTDRQVEQSRYGRKEADPK